jgi:hypothetical protein
MILSIRFEADFASFLKNKIIHFRKILKMLIFPEITPFHSIKMRLYNQRRLLRPEFGGFSKNKKAPAGAFF